MLPCRSSATASGVSGAIGADPAQQLAFAVVEAAGHHRAVQIEKDRVATLAHGVDDRAGETLVGVVVDRAAGIGGGVDGDLELCAALPARVDERAERRPRAVRRVRRCAAERRTVGAERGERCGHRRERVRLVVHSCGDDAHRAESNNATRITSRRLCIHTACGLTFSLPDTRQPRARGPSAPRRATGRSP